MKILHYNVGHATGICQGYHEYISKGWRFPLCNRKMLEEISGFISSVDADVVHLLEIKNKPRKNQFEIFSSLLNYPESFYFCKINKIISKMPFMHGGTAVFSRVPLNNEKVHDFSSGVKRKFLQLDTKDVAFFFLHLSLGKRARKKQIDEISSVVKNCGKKIVLVGDFNTFGGSSELDMLLKECDLKLTNLEHLPTFPAWNPSKEFDYIITSSDIKVNSFKVLENKLADHLPVLIDLDL